MARPHSIRRTAAALLLLAVAVAILASLGRWQLQRADERRAILHAIEAGRRQAPLQLSRATPPADLVPWRAALASGTWLPDLSILLENRNYEGRPGYWLATPLLLDPPARGAVLVLRGWLPRVLPGQALTLPAAPAGVQTVRGELATHVPRLFELWSFGQPARGQLPDALPTPERAAPRLQNVDLAAYGRSTGLALLPAVLMQTEDVGDGLVRDWPQPSVDYNQNLGYAMQWFAFAAIAAAAWLVVAARALLRSRRRPQ